MPLTPGLLGAAAPPDETPDTKKGAPDLFRELGIFSPSEKQQMAIQQQQAQFLIQQQQDQQRRQQALQAAQVGTGLGFPVFTAMGGLNRGPKMPGAPSEQQFDQGADEPSRIVSSELANSPNDRAGALGRAGMKMMQLGSQKGDPTLQRIGSNLIMKAQEEAQKQQKAQAEQADADRKAAQAGNPGDTYTKRDAAGNIITSRQIKDKLGGYIGDEQLGKGPNKQINQAIDDPRTQSQQGDDFKEFRLAAENSDATISKIRTIKQGLKQGAAQGWAASGVKFVDNIVGSLGQFYSTAKLNEKATQELASQNGSTFQSWASRTGINSAVWSDLVSSLAKTYNPTGTITEKDITRAAEVVGRNLSNPATVVNVLDEVSKQTASGVERKYKYLSPRAQEDAKSMLGTFRTTYRGKVVRTGKRSNGKKVSEYENGEVVDE